MRVIVFGAHPDDPDSGTGGLMALLSERGHDVIAVSFTRGELTGRTGSVKENARINEREAVMAFKLLGSKIVFLDFKDGNVWVTKETLIKVKNLIEEYKPEIILTHWPIDSHSDHQSVGVVTINAIRNISSTTPMLYFYEVMTGRQTHCFIPDIYVDISEKAELKKRACYLHKNCFPEKWYPIHEEMMRFRGLEMGVKYAEAFISFKKTYAHKLKNLL